MYLLARSAKWCVWMEVLFTYEPVCYVAVSIGVWGHEGGHNTYLGERLELDELPELSGMRLESASTSLREKQSVRKPMSHTDWPTQPYCTPHSLTYP